MATTFEKLNLKDHKQAIVLYAPSSFEGQIEALADVKIERTLDAVANPQFLLAFVTHQNELDAIASRAIAATEGDIILWFAYPKGTSKRLKCDFNRDTGWEILKSAGFDTVRAVSIDEDWSAIRFRRIEFIKNSLRRPS